jgi:type VI secretion system secreted protein Hcp
MPMQFYMQVTGVDSGTNYAEGVGIQTGFEDFILCQALEHKVHIPSDPQSGQPTGTRIHGALKVTKVFDKASPLLYNALCIGERLTVALQFYRIDSSGNMEHYFTISLTNAIIVSMRPWIPNCLDPSNSDLTHMEDVSFTYEQIDWTQEVDGTTASDSWLVPPGA